MSEQPNNTSKSSHRLPEKNFGSHEDISTWYRDLRPDRDINEVPVDTHLDAITSSVLLSMDMELPSERRDRLVTLGRLLDAPQAVRNGAANKLISQGPNACTFLDLTTELAEREDQGISPKHTKELLNFGIHVAREIRNTEGMDREEKLRANKKWASLREAELRHRARYFPDEVKDFDKEYIAIVTAEANYIHMWPANESVARAGALFETMVGTLAKHRAWKKGLASEVVVRHATDREDMPSRGNFHARGHAFAHDIVVRGQHGGRLLQCKWHEDRERDYDRNKITMVNEASEDGEMTTTGDMKAVFTNIAGNTARPTITDRFIDRAVQRYPEIESAINRAARPREARMGEAMIHAD